MSWYRLVVSHEQAVRGMVDQVQEMMSKMHIAAGAPVGVFMYGVNRELTSDSTYYFSPAAVSIAENALRSLGPVECPAPDVNALSVQFERVV